MCEKQLQEDEEQCIPVKRVNIVSLQLIKESSLLYKNRSNRNHEDGFNLLKQFLEDVDRGLYGE